MKPTGPLPQPACAPCPARDQGARHGVRLGTVPRPRRAVPTLVPAPPALWIPHSLTSLSRQRCAAILSADLNIPSRPDAHPITEPHEISRLATTYIGPLDPRINTYMAHPVGTMATYLLRRMSRVDKDLVDIAEYFGETGLFGSGHGSPIYWPLKDGTDSENEIVW